MGDEQLLKAVERQTLVLQVIAKELCFLVQCHANHTSKALLDRMAGSVIDEMDNLFRSWYGQKTEEEKKDE